MGDDGKSCMAVYEDEFETVDFAHIEQTVTEWAAEHPVVYPTWGEWLQRIYNSMNYAGIFITPIPADIAQKLGIEPKEDACTD
jgi:hypothetical protein